MIKNSNQNVGELVYDVVLSFAGENRNCVEKISNSLKLEVTRFYIKNAEIEMWSQGLPQHSQNIYSFGKAKHRDVYKKVGNAFAGAWSIYRTKEQGLKFNNLRLLVSYGILQKDGILRTGGRIYYSIPTVERVLPELIKLKK